MVVFASVWVAFRERIFNNNKVNCYRKVAKKAVGHQTSDLSECSFLSSQI